MKRVWGCFIALILIPVAGGCPSDPTMLAQSGDPCAPGAYLTLTGTIDEVEDTVMDLLAVNPNSTDSIATHDERMHIELDLRTNPVSGKLEGTAKVLQTQHNTLHHVEPTEGCGDILYIDYENREWTVDITAEISCSPGPFGTTLVRVFGLGSPNGSDVPQLHRYHNGSCFDQTRDQSVRDTWDRFSESGFESVGGNDLRIDRKTAYPIPPNATGEFYKDVHLKLTLVAPAPES